MSENFKKAKVVDGFVTLRAAQRAKDPARPEEVPDEISGSPASASQGDKVASHIGRTVLPSRIDLVCFECGFAFHLTGRSRSTYCPKCRCMMDLGDITVDGPCSEEVKTGGTITITRDAELEEVDLYGGQIILEGSAGDARLHASRKLILGKEALFHLDRVFADNVEVLSDAELELPEPFTVYQIELFGSLDAELTVEGRMHIHPGGCLRGRLKSGHLVVEEGGGLMADVQLEPGSVEAPA